jgi:DNA-directed RNA polymerase subunit RPC12/RpoP
MVKVKCNKCSYEWGTKSKMYHTSCPRCGSRVLVPKVKDISNGEYGDDKE